MFKLSLGVAGGWQGVEARRHASGIPQKIGCNRNYAGDLWAGGDDQARFFSIEEIT